MLCDRELMRELSQLISFSFIFLLIICLYYLLDNRDLLRELDKKYEVLLIFIFLLFLLFLVSEGLLFVSFFWTSFHSLCSPTLGIWFGEGFYLPDPCIFVTGHMVNNRNNSLYFSLRSPINKIWICEISSKDFSIIRSGI